MGGESREMKGAGISDRADESEGARWEECALEGAHGIRDGPSCHTQTEQLAPLAVCGQAPACTWSTCAPSSTSPRSQSGVVGGCCDSGCRRRRREGGDPTPSVLLQRGAEVNKNGSWRRIIQRGGARLPCMSSMFLCAYHLKSSTKNTACRCSGWLHL